MKHRPTLLTLTLGGIFLLLPNLSSAGTTTIEAPVRGTSNKPYYVNFMGFNPNVQKAGPIFSHCSADPLIIYVDQFGKYNLQDQIQWVSFRLPSNRAIVLWSHRFFHNNQGDKNGPGLGNHRPDAVVLRGTGNDELRNLADVTRSQTSIQVLSLSASYPASGGISTPEAPKENSQQDITTYQSMQNEEQRAREASKPTTIYIREDFFKVTRSAGVFSYPFIPAEFNRIHAQMPK